MHKIIFVNQLQKTVVTYVDGQEAQGVMENPHSLLGSDVRRRTRLCLLQKCLQTKPAQ